VYLNTEFEGGTTRFFPSTQFQATEDLREPVGGDDIHPVAGMVLVFQHDLFHQGMLVAAGTKYTIRGDILYDLSGGAE